MERETGFEPATSSLGNWAKIVNKDFSVSGSDFKRRKITEFPFLCSVRLLMEYKRSADRDRFASGEGVPAVVAGWRRRLDSSYATFSLEG
jgi:hypothetical protein